MFPIELLAGAHKDFDESFDWYAARSMGTALRFTDVVNAALDEIARDPERFARIDERHRERLVKRFPFRVIYRVVEERIIIVAIAHAKRNPDYWAMR
jgi:plasmid stabilization system protein ParE